MNCYSQEGFGLVVKGLVEDHLPTVWSIDPEVVGIRLNIQIKKKIKQDSVFIYSVLIS